MNAIFLEGKIYSRAELISLIARVSELERERNKWAGRASGYVQQEQTYGTHKELFSRATEAEAKLAELKGGKMAPVQGYEPGIPWELHLRAYSEYRRQHGAQESLITGGCRGGFHTTELDIFIPGWREDAAETTRLKLALSASEQRCEELRKVLGPTANYELSVSSAHKICNECASGYQIGSYIHSKSCISGRVEKVLSALSQPQNKPVL